jgi:hypothetical protein
VTWKKTARMNVKLQPISRPPETESTDEAVSLQLLRALAPLHRTAMGVSWGATGGVLLAVATLVLLLREPMVANFNLLGQFLWGYRVSLRGVFVGMLWGFGVGFVLGYGFALVRNAAVWIWLTVIRLRAEMEQYSDFLDHL